jgi:hypothetical protein
MARSHSFMVQQSHTSQKRDCSCPTPYSARASVSYSRCTKHGRKQKEQMTRYLFRNATILDAERGDYLPDGSVLVEGDHILEVGGADVHASEVQSFDLRGVQRFTVVDNSPSSPTRLTTFLDPGYPSF